jgi:uncharacterized protein YprB with RNaseH-like and TPR domain
VSTLSDRLDQIAARRRLAAPAAAPSRPRALDTAAALGGRELNSCADLPPCWCVETPVAASDAGDPALSAVVIDIETGGFAGHPVFLIGVMSLGRRPPTIVQWLARDYPEEPTLLHLLAATVAEPQSVWVTFNGRSFDEPFLRDRSVLHGVPLPTPSRHIDVLPAARRRWRTVVPDCRLETLEAHILGRTRVGDVPGRDIPELFHHFVRTRNARPLRPVLERNRLDLLATTALFQRLLAERQVSLTAD